jgi:hypothetical protein
MQQFSIIFSEIVLATLLLHMPPPTFSNQKNSLSLSLSLSGAGSTWSRAGLALPGHTEKYK